MPAREDVLDALRTVQDPDLSQDLVSLGFIQDLRLDGPDVAFTVELTTPACPAREALEAACRRAVEALPGVGTVSVHMTARTRGGRVASGEAAAALAGVRQVLLVASGKGGVGKSTTAVNLAYALAATGARVGLLDADVQGPSLPSLTGVGPPTEQDDAGRLVPPELDGVALLSMGMFLAAGQAAILRGPRVTGVVRQLLTSAAWGDRDYLVVDTPPGTGDVLITLAQLAPVAGAVLVTTPQDLALADVRRGAHLFREVDVPILGVVETLSGFVCTDCGSLHHLFGQGGGDRVADELGVPLLGRIPFDPAMVAGAQRGRPTVVAAPRAPASRAYTAVAGAIAARLSTLALQAEARDVLEDFELVWERP